MNTHLMEEEEKVRERSRDGEETTDSRRQKGMEKLNSIL